MLQGDVGNLSQSLTDGWRFKERIRLEHEGRNQFKRTWRHISVVGMLV